MLNKLCRIASMILILIVVFIYVANSYINSRVLNMDYSKEDLVSLVQNVESMEVSESKREVFDGLTMNELAEKLEKSMTSNLDGYGYKFASYAISLGLDPYLCLAIVLEETGCTWGCSGLVTGCNNIGGQKGSGCGEYQRFSSMEAGIEGFLNNIYKNYYSYGLTTASAMNPKYAENPLWARNVNAYITRIKNK